MQKTIFVVDDNGTNLSMANNALKNHYKVITLPSADRMFKFLERLVPDLILLDIEMPEMDGFEALDLLKKSNAFMNIPVIFLTSMTDEAVEVKGFQMGVIDFITKPFSTPVLLNRIKTHLEIDSIIRDRTTKIQTLQNGIVFVLADMVDNRDKGTGGHIRRTAAYLEILMDAMIDNDVYADELKGLLRALDLELLISSAKLHDVGKIAISDTILNKPGKLTEEEFDVMKTHSLEGESIIDQIITRTGAVEFLRNARLFAGTHHERWDGKGYPRGLSGTDIPLLGRIMAIVDVYDALLSERPYKAPFTQEESRKIISDSAGTQLDPYIVEVFLKSMDKLMLVER